MKAHKKKKANAKQQPILDRKKNNKNNDNTGHNSGSSSSKRSAKHNRDNDTDATSAAAARKTKKSRTSNNLEHSQQVAELTLKTQSTSNNNSSDSCGETHVQPLTPPPSTDTTTVATSEPDATNTIPTSASNMSLEQGHPPPLQKKDKHVAVETSDDENHTTNATTTNKSATTNTTKKTRGSSSIRITTEDKVTDLNLPPTPPTSASLEDSGEVEPTADGLDDYKGCADDEWFAHMGWHFEEKSGDLNFVDSDGNLFDYEKHYDRFEFVQAEIQGLVYNRLRDKYGFQQIVVAQNESTSASNGGEYHRFPRIFVSPNIHTSTAILVLVPKGGDETPGQWSRTMFTSGEKGNILFASQFSYIDLALNEGWGVVLCDPNGGDLYDSDEYRQSHVLYVWDDILQPSQATCVMYVALGEGTDAVLSILDSSRADEFRQRVKGVALLDGTNGDKRDEKLNRVWLNKPQTNTT
ncbi:hypothetical protein EC991_004552 [Linnemannia zychae]|nr:hypothetical protein EC991_004552 [Linnemannia zychae]